MIEYERTGTWLVLVDAYSELVSAGGEVWPRVRDSPWTQSTGPDAGPHHAAPTLAVWRLANATRITDEMVAALPGD
jgi:hypothetical protein